ncbi:MULTISPECIES: hypothetical protein [unclassified Psychrobacillus]|uniref:hypothetical protein n=1 Tax=unclassified Psychrobacillus TaxID=2636677 RepID=UPI0030F90B55
MSKIKGYINNWLEKWNEPTIIVKSENAYSLVAKWELEKDSSPFRRFQKYQNEDGMFIMLRKDKPVYEKNWNRINIKST